MLQIETEHDKDAQALFEKSQKINKVFHLLYAHSIRSKLTVVYVHFALIDTMGANDICGVSAIITVLNRKFLYCVYSNVFQHGLGVHIHGIAGYGRERR